MLGKDANRWWNKDVLTFLRTNANIGTAEVCHTEGEDGGIKGGGMSARKLVNFCLYAGIGRGRLLPPYGNMLVVAYVGARIF